MPLMFCFSVHALAGFVVSDSVLSVQGETFESADSAPTPHGQFQQTLQYFWQRVPRRAPESLGIRDIGRRPFTLASVA